MPVAKYIMALLRRGGPVDQGVINQYFSVFQPAAGRDYRVFGNFQSEIVVDISVADSFFCKTGVDYYTAEVTPLQSISVSPELQQLFTVSVFPRQDFTSQVRS